MGGIAGRGRDGSGITGALGGGDSDADSSGPDGLGTERRGTDGRGADGLGTEGAGGVDSLTFAPFPLPSRPNSSPGAPDGRCRKPAGSGMREGTRRPSGGSLPLAIALSRSGSTPSPVPDPEDRLGLFTAGDSTFDSPSVGDEELTRDSLRQV